METVWQVKGVTQSEEALMFFYAPEERHNIP